MRQSRRTGTIFYTTSLVLHLGAGVAIAGIVVHRPPPTIAVTMRSVEVPEAEETPPPPPPPPEPEAPRPRHRAPRPQRAAASEPPPADAPPPEAASPPPDYGIALGNLGPGPGGIAVPVGDPGGVRGAGPRRSSRRTLGPPASPARARSDGCDEEEVRPRPITMPHPAYTDEAREAAVEGRVRVRITVDATGRVSDAQVLAPLGYGLDESALAAVREASFEPATRCGRAVSTTFVISVRFTL